MFPKFLLFLAMCVSAVASASEPQQITVWKLDAGYYIVSGSQIVAFPPGGPVIPPNDPVVPPQTPFAQAVTAAVTAIPESDKRHQAAMKLTATYQMFAGQLKDGKLHPTSAVAAAELLCPIALGSDKAAWGPVLAVVNAEVGKAGTPEATAAVFTQAAEVVLSTVPNSGPALAMMQAGMMMGENEEMTKLAKSFGFDWSKFMEFVMDLFLKLLPFIIS